MDARVSLAKAGIVVAALFAGWHLCWSALVALRWAQPVIDFIFWIHFIKPIYVVEAFDALRAVILVSVTAAIGFALGCAGALAWNTLHKTR